MITTYDKLTELFWVDFLINVIISNILAGKVEGAISIIPANERYIGRIAKPHNFK